ncbi:MAG TPA: hypothetical protein VM097_03905 [Mycobacteriales bacterium]|nr:hypothetical protein [Mycobacteriales bacterium]
MALRRRRPEKLDLHEQAAQRMRAGLEPFEPLPPDPRRIDRKRLLLYVFVGAVLVAVFRDGLGRGAPPVEGSCTKPAFALDRVEVAQYGVVKWSVAGPTGAQVVITADTPSADTGRLVGPLPLKQCKASGRFGIPLADGDHVLRVFLRQVDGTTTLVGQQTLTVNVPR